jgi:hypothetical protein
MTIVSEDLRHKLTGCRFAFSFRDEKFDYRSRLSLQACIAPSLLWSTGLPHWLEGRIPCPYIRKVEEQFFKDLSALKSGHAPQRIKSNGDRVLEQREAFLLTRAG